MNIIKRKVMDYNAICGICALWLLESGVWLNMSRKRKPIERIVVMSSIEATRAKMPRYYPASRCGRWKSKRDYDRKDKSWKNEEW